MNIDIIIDNWLGEKFPKYHVWSIPNPAYPGWSVRSYILHLGSDALIASLKNDGVVCPLDDWKSCAKEILDVHDPEFFRKLETFMRKVSKNNKCRNCS